LNDCDYVLHGLVFQYAGNRLAAPRP
jgi:hypothetical protein